MLSLFLDVPFALSTSFVIVLVISTTTSIIVFLGLAVYRKSFTLNSLALSALLGFFVILPLSLLLGPTAAIVVGAVTGLIQYKFDKSFRFHFIIPVVIISVILFGVVNYFDISLTSSTVWDS